jgi:probable F420-dependent oxidoreductase
MLFPWGAKTPDVGEIVEAAVLAEELGFHSVSLPMHMTMPPGWLFTTFPNQDVLDAMVVLPAIAQATSRIRLGTNSALLPLLPPYQWAKYFATLDVMSGGRVIAGFAMGWWEEDFTSVGVDRRKRGKMFDEQLDAITRLWTEARVTFEGEHYQFADMPLEPKPVHKPYPPIWIGGGEKSIGRVARYGELIVPFWPSEDEARTRWLPKLREANDQWGRDARLGAFTFVYVAENDADFQAMLPRLRDAVAFVDPDTDPLGVTISGTPERCAERLTALHAAGVDHFVVEFQFHGIETVAFGMAQMKVFAREVMPLL